MIYLYKAIRFIESEMITKFCLIRFLLAVDVLWSVEWAV